MAKIGSFKKVSGEIKGQIATLGFQAKSVRFVPEQDATGNAPSHRVYMGEAEIGAAWTKPMQDGRPFLSVKLDCPTFFAPVYAGLFEDNESGQYDLIWHRQSRQQRN